MPINSQSSVQIKCSHVEQVEEGWKEHTIARVSKETPDLVRVSREQAASCSDLKICVMPTGHHFIATQHGQYRPQTTGAIPQEDNPFPGQQCLPGILFFMLAKLN